MNGSSSLGFASLAAKGVLTISVMVLAGSNSRAQSNYSSSERGPYHAVWERVTWQTNLLGEATAQTNSFVEVAAGLNYLDEAGQWRPSEDLIELMPDGGAAALRGPAKVHFKPNLNVPGAITLTTVSNRVFRTRPLAIVLFNASSGEAALAASVQDCVGELVAPNQIVYRSAFGPLADVRLVYTKAGVESDVVLLQQPRLPDEWDPRDARLEVWHEWLDAPTPQQTPKLIHLESDSVARSRMVEPDLIDHVLDFGEPVVPNRCGILNGRFNRNTTERSCAGQGARPCSGK